MHKLPQDFRKALIGNATALAAWKHITPLARNERLAEIQSRNLQRYGDPLRPSVNWLLRAQGRTWKQITESATRTGGRDLGF